MIYDISLWLNIIVERNPFPPVSMLSVSLPQKTIIFTLWFVREPLPPSLLFLKDGGVANLIGKRMIFINLLFW